MPIPNKTPILASFTNPTSIEKITYIIMLDLSYPLPFYYRNIPHRAGSEDGASWKMCVPKSLGGVSIFD